MSAAVKLLDRLDRPRQTRPGAWSTGCPCCQSKRGRPISVRELEDGRVLLHAFCGCETEAVLGAIGLSITDLFDAPLAHHAAPSAANRVPARDLLSAISEEVSVVAVIATDLLDRQVISQEDWARLAQAVRRIGAARDHAR
jgi:hypothetical protein